jgi:transmembrane sensor
MGARLQIDMSIGLKLLNSESSATDEAAAWFARHRAGPWSVSEEAEFGAWLRADPSHIAAWASFERLWGQLETVRDDPKVLAIREEARRRAERRRTLRRAVGFGGALAASFVIASATWWTARSWVAPWATRLVHGSILARAPTESARETQLVRDTSTDIGERSLVVLPDGSKVTLNTASAVHGDYTGHDRRVTLLRGEAFFDVAKDASRPFIVSAGSRQVIAVGTAFDVRLQERVVKVTLVEGKVRVVRARSTAVRTPDSTGARVGSATMVPPRTETVDSASTVTLEAGSVLIASEEGADRVEHLDATRATSWRTGKLVFDGERLAEVVAEMNRYSREKLEIADPALEGRKVSGVFEPTGGPAFAKALEAYGIARVSRQSATTIVLDSSR